ncbi:MAG: tetratricopeptide repeat protein [Minwuia sp.]|uniref:tetratricopeptide repeat protein n=1 Tax=Minwuia sp. TaxID=2493630 RepID=UPI003A8C6721
MSEAHILETGEQVAALRDEARALVEEGRDAQADVRWRALLELAPDDGEAARCVAARACQQGLGPTALVYFVRAARRAAPEASDLHLGAAIVSLLTGERQSVDPATWQPDDPASSIAEAAANLPPADLWPEARSVLQSVAAAGGADMTDCTSQPGDAFSDFLDAAPEADALIERCTSAVPAGERSEGFNAALDRARTEPSDPECWQALGRERQAQEDFDTAVACFRKAASIDRLCIRYRMAVARALTGAGRYDLAFAAYNGIGDLPVQGRTDSYHLEEAAANQRSILSNLILMTRQAVGELDPDRAWSIFELIRDKEEVQDREGIRSSILRLSIDQVMRAHKSDAADTLELARAHLRRDPESVYVRQVLGQTLMGQGRHREAADIWGSLTSSMPDNARMFLQYAKCLERIGDGEAALAAARQALKLDSSLEFAAIIEARLAT